MQFMLWLSVTQNELGPHTTLEQGSRQNFSFLLGMEMTFVSDLIHQNCEILKAYLLGMVWQTSLYPQSVV